MCSAACRRRLERAAKTPSNGRKSVYPRRVTRSQTLGKQGGLSTRCSAVRCFDIAFDMSNRGRKGPRARPVLTRAGRVAAGFQWRMPILIDLGQAAKWGPADRPGFD